MAHAAVLSLTQTTAEIIFLHPISHTTKQQIRSIYEPFIFLKEFLEEFPDETPNNLYDRIKDVSCEAEDLIASFLSEKIPSHCWGALAAKFKFKRQMRRIMQETDSITIEVRNLKHNKVATIKDDSSSAAAGSSSRLAPISKIGHVIGLNEDLLTIKSRLCEESPNLQVIPICGMGGIGKTTLARSVYDDPLTLQHFDIRVWVTLSQDYSADVILSRMLASMKEFDKEMCEQSSGLGEEVFKILKSRRYVIVMDDIWSVEAWDEIRAILPDDGNGSRVVLTTRLTDVAAYPDPCSPLHMMRLMDDNQSCVLLKDKVFGNGNQDFPLELERIVEEIARNCRGLPLAIVVVGGILSTVGMDPSSWRDIAHDVRSAVSSKGQFDNILSLSYTHLPHHLRPCFLYMGMFPEDHEIRVSKLVKLWVAEEFLRRPDGSKSLEEEAEECLEDLVRRSLVLVSKRKFDGKIKACSLHDLMRDLCIRKAHEGKFLLNFRGWEDRRYFPLVIREDQRRVSLTPSGLPYLSKIHGSTIQTILCFRGVSIRNMLGRFRLLMVLDAGDVYVRSLPDDIFDLFHLVYIGIYYVGSISPAICKLRKIQTLILHSRNAWRHFRADWICLPQEIWTLPKLRHLVFYGRLPNPQERIASTLENLQTLSLVSHSMCSERILSMIPNLKKLEIDCSGCCLDEVYLNNLVRLSQLEELKLRSSLRDGICQKDLFTFPKSLKKLTLCRLPLPWEEMSIVGSLPNLRVLKLTHGAGKGNTWETSEGEFAELEFLLIEKSGLEHWRTESSHFPVLKRLVLDDCWQLAEIPEGIGEIPTLELIEVKGVARMSLMESAKRILEEQRGWGNDALQVRCMTHR